MEETGSGDTRALLAMTSGKLVTVLQTMMLSIAIPTIIRYFDTNIRTMVWLSLMYLVCRYAFMVSVGHLADRIGRKKVYVSGLTLFTFSVALAGLSVGMPMLVVAGALMGFAAGMIRATFPGLVAACSPRARTGRAFGLANTMVNSALLFGPFLGGMIVTHVGWRFVFILNLPLCALAILASTRYVRESTGGQDTPMDKKGTFLLLATLVPMAVGLHLTGDYGWTSPVVLTLIIIAIVSGWLFQKHGRNALFPVVDLRLLRKPRFALANVTLMFQSMGFEVFCFAVPFFLQGYFGLLPDRAGLVICIVGAASVSVNYLSGRATDRYGSLPMEFSGLFLLVLAYGLIGFLHAGVGLLVVVAAMVLVGLGDGLFDPANISEVMLSIPRTELGVAGGINETMNELGKILGIPIAELAMGEWAHLKVSKGGSQMLADPRLLAAIDNIFMVALVATLLAVAVCFVRTRYVRRGAVAGLDTTH